MKNFTKFSLPLLSLMFLMHACTKDIVPDPDTLNAALASQMRIYDENFDSADVVLPNLPTGWTAAPASGWATKNSNPSYILNTDSGGYTGASGNNNVVISNPTSGPASYDTLTSKSIASTGFNNITITYGARNSSHFSDNGSAITSLAFSVDNGVTWTNLPYVENTKDSDWHLVNNSVRISLPASANNQASLIFRWIAHIYATASGTYRFDDFQVFGTSI